jgi:bacteriorhodopsin
MTLTPDLVEKFFYVIGFLALTNISTVLGGVFSYFRRIKRMRRDINNAFAMIRTLKDEVKNLKKEEENVL